METLQEYDLMRALAPAYLSTSLAWCCVPLAIGGHGGDQNRVADVLRGPFRLLVAEGYWIPPAVAVDLDWLLRQKGNFRFAPPRNLGEQGANTLRPYCSWLNEQATASPIHRVATRLALLRHAASEEISIDRALLTLLRGFASRMPFWSSHPRVNIEEFLTHVGGSDVAGLVGASPNPEFSRAFGEFYQRCDPMTLCTLNDASDALLAEASAHLVGGDDALDYCALDALLHFDELPEHQRRQHGVLLQRVKPRLLTVDPSPEFGNTGVTNRGTLATILRSHLARPALEERLAHGGMLYYDRRGRASRPIRVFLAWVIDRSELMQRPIPSGGQRRISFALKWVAESIEDAARRLGGHAAIQLRFGAVAHDGQRGKRARLSHYVPRHYELEAVARRHMAEPLVLNAAEFFPSFLTRKPIFDLQGGDDQGAGDNPHAVRGGSADADALASLVRRVLALEPDAEQSDPFDFAQAVVLSPEADDASTRAEASDSAKTDHGSYEDSLRLPLKAHSTACAVQRIHVGGQSRRVRSEWWAPGRSTRPLAETYVLQEELQARQVPQPEGGPRAVAHDELRAVFMERLLTCLTIV